MVVISSAIAGRSEFRPVWIRTGCIQDLLFTSAFFIVGAILAFEILQQSERLYFYQLYMPELVYWACGHQTGDLASLPATLLDFLKTQTKSFDCSSLGDGSSNVKSGIFFRAHLYLGLIVTALWRLTSVSYDNLWPLPCVLVGAYAAGSFVLLRLLLGRYFGVLGATVLTLSPIALSMTIYMRDYAKAPFFIWCLVALICTLRASTNIKAIGFATIAGCTIGIGYGFRSDVIIMLPIGVLALMIGSFASRWRILAPVYIGATLLFASPILTIGNSGGFGVLLIEGLSEPFRVYLDLEGSPISFGAQYSDELALSSVAADLRPTDPGWDQREGQMRQAITQAAMRSGPYTLGWIRFFAGDLATQALKSAAWIVGFPALVAPDRDGLDPSWTVNSAPDIVQSLQPLYDWFAESSMPLICGIGLVAFFWRRYTRCRREALALLVVFGSLLSYTVVQFSVRHIFHLEFIWVLAFLSLFQIPFASRRQWQRLPSSVGIVALVGVVVGLLYFALLAYQDRALERQLISLLQQPRVDVPMAKSQTLVPGSEMYAVAIPEIYRALTEAEPDSMTNTMGEKGVQADVRASADRLVLTVGGDACPAGSLKLSLVYATKPNVWQKLDSDVTVAVGEAPSGTTKILFPAFYRPTQHFAGISVSAALASCIQRLERISGPTRLPVLLTAILPSGWQARPLHRQFGGFSPRRPSPL